MDCKSISYLSNIRIVCTYIFNDVKRNDSITSCINKRTLNIYFILIIRIYIFKIFIRDWYKNYIVESPESLFNMILSKKTILRIKFNEN